MTRVAVVGLGMGLFRHGGGPEQSGYTGKALFVSLSGKPKIADTRLHLTGYGFAEIISRFTHDPPPFRPGYLCRPGSSPVPVPRYC